MTTTTAQDKQLLQKQAVAKAAINFIEDGMILGVGTGSTVNCFIDLLSTVNLKGAVASSNVTEEKLRALDIEIYDLNFAGTLDLYIDGADEVNNKLELVKGGGGALTREKIVAAASRKFLCMVDESKMVDQLAVDFPLPIEVLPQARSYVARELVKMGGEPVLREGFVTDYGNIILDTYGLNIGVEIESNTNVNISNALEMEQRINNIVGVVCNGLFAANKADIVLKASDVGVETIQL